MREIRLSRVVAVFRESVADRHFDKPLANHLGLLEVLPAFGPGLVFLKSVDADEGAKFVEGDRKKETDPLDFNRVDARQELVDREIAGVPFLSFLFRVW
jgi:hypothetical protein